MTADAMFEELGYSRVWSIGEKHSVVTYKKRSTLCYDQVIEIHKDGVASYFANTKIEDIEYMPISIRELCAINQALKEMGVLDGHANIRTE